MPKVTIIIPAQESDTHLDRCLQSLLEQTEPDFEIIVPLKSSSSDVDSVSNDPRIVWAPKIEGKSMAAITNSALRMAQAEHILFVNPNDLVSTDLIESVLPWAQLTDNDLVLFGHVSHHGKSNDVHLPLLRVGDDKESIFRCLLLEHKGIGTQRWQYLYKRDFLSKKNIWFDESLTQFYDLLFIAKALFYCNGVSSVSKPLYDHYKSTPTGLPFQQRTNDRFLAIESLKLFLTKNNAYEKYKDEFTLFQLRFGYILATYEYLNLSNKQINAQAKQYIKQVLKNDEFKSTEVQALKLPSDINRNKNTLSYKELQRLKTTICDRFTLLEISYKFTLKLLRYKRKPVWTHIPRFLHNPLLILQESKSSI